MDRSSELQTLLEGLDISATDSQKARERYEAVGKWLSEGDFGAGSSTEVYVQGSFRLGTVVRPFLNGQDADYDIDQVCEISGSHPDARTLKHAVGDRLKAHGTFGAMLDEEGRRCWTIQYASPDGRPGFHLDVLPARPTGGIGTLIDITHKDNGSTGYVWRTSNPRGYYAWFETKNAQMLSNQRRLIFEANRAIYSSVDAVPEWLVRTSLQRAIQLMKRHRDVSFSGREGAPISIIITTICTDLYGGGSISETIRAFVRYVESRLASVVGVEPLTADGILDRRDGKWVVANPADPNENFAERWADDPELADNFFAWVYQLRRDLDAFEHSGFPPDMGLAANTPATGRSSYAEMLVQTLSARRIDSSEEFLDLIHQGIEGRIAWPKIKQLAQRNVDEINPDDIARRDVAKVNYYQVKVHSGEGLTPEDGRDIVAILNRNKSSPEFVYCCHALVGKATAQMLRDAIVYRDRPGQPGIDVMRWPITRLVAGRSDSSSGVMVPAPTRAFFHR